MLDQNGHKILKELEQILKVTVPKDGVMMIASKKVCIDIIALDDKLMKAYPEYIDGMSMNDFIATLPNGLRANIIINALI